MMRSLFHVDENVLVSGGPERTVDDQREMLKGRKEKRVESTGSVGVPSNGFCSQKRVCKISLNLGSMFL